MRRVRAHRWRLPRSRSWCSALAGARLVGATGGCGQPAASRRQLQLCGACGRAVTVERDASASRRSGASRAGRRPRHRLFHAQDRFFQMDLARRRAAGELAALVGARRLRLDRERGCTASAAEARTAVALLSPRRPACSRPTPPASTRPGGAGGASPFEYRPAADARSRGGPRTACSSCCRCSSRCRTRTALRVDARDDARRAAAGDVRPAGAGAAPNGTRRWSACRSRPPPCPEPRSTTCGASATGKPEIELPDRSRDRGARRPDARGTPTHDERRARQQQLGGVGEPDAPTARALVANDMHLDDPRAEHLVSRRARVARREPTAADPRARSAPRSPACPRSSPAATPTSPGASPTPTRTGATWSCSTSIPTDSEPLPDAGRLAALRRTTTRRSRSPARRPRAPRPCAGRSGGRCSAPTYKGRLRACALGRRTRPTGWRVADAARTGAHARGSVRRGQRRSARRARTWSSADRSGTHRLDDLRRDPATASASTAGCPRRGPTAGAAGTAGSTPADYPRLIDPPGGPHLDRERPRGRRRMLARLGDGSYEVGSRATRSATACASASSSRRATCWTSSSTRARRSWPAGAI